jgi:hypothetical protein
MDRSLPILPLCLLRNSDTTHPRHHHQFGSPRGSPSRILESNPTSKFRASPPLFKLPISYTNYIPSTSFFYELCCPLVTLFITIAQITAHIYSCTEPITFLVSSILLFSSWSVQVGLSAPCDLGGECAIYWSQTLPKRDDALFWVKMALGLMIMAM